MYTVKGRIVTALVLSKLTDILLSAKTTLPTLLNALGVPSWMLGFLVPLREAGALLPQAAMSAWLIRKRSRRMPWVVSMLIQMFFIFAMIFVPLILLPLFMSEASQLYALLSGLIVLASLVGLSFARAMTSLTMKDIQGKHLEKGTRGNAVGIASTIAGVLSLSFATFTFLAGKMNEQVILIIAVLCFVAMLLSVLTLKSLETDIDVMSSSAKGPRSKKVMAAKITSYIKTFSGQLGLFVLVRSCFVHTALIAPFFIVWASSLSSQDGFITLSGFIIAQAAATILSSYIWGLLSDHNAKLTMQLGAITVLLVCLASIFIIHFELRQFIHSIWFVIGYFLMSVGHEGARSGRKIYALDIKEGSDRTDFIGKANTAIGAVILLLGAFYATLTFAGNLILFSMIALGISVGLLLSVTMKNEKSQP
jgi:hypothetical protein